MKLSSEELYFIHIVFFGYTVGSGPWVWTPWHNLTTSLAVAESTFNSCSSDLPIFVDVEHWSFRHTKHTNMTQNECARNKEFKALFENFFFVEPKENGQKKLRRSRKPSNPRNPLKVWDWGKPTSEMDSALSKQGGTML